MINCEICFVQRSEGLPQNWRPGIHWLVEAHDLNNDLAHPIGIAYVTVAPTIVSVDYILVADESRRNGVATSLWRAIKARWPNAILTEAVSEEGEKFLDSLDRQAANEGFDRA